jgi:hypothetical protein
VTPSPAAPLNRVYDRLRKCAWRKKKKEREIEKEEKPESADLPAS